MKITSPLAIVLDTTPLSILAQRPGHLAGDACRAWALGLTNAGCRIYVPEVADYETRRELMRTGNWPAVSRLDTYIGAAPGRYLPLTTPAVRLACALWAEVRQAGRPTASPDALDGDVLISAQARLIVPAAFGLSSVVIATANAGHMTAIAGIGSMPRVPAELWTNIQP